jgi:hypothetical protein
MTLLADIHGKNVIYGFNSMCTLLDSHGIIILLNIMDNIFGITTSYGLGDPGFESLKGKVTFIYFTMSDWLWGSRSLLFSGS